MKFVSLLTLLALTVTSTLAGDCTYQEFEDASKKPELLAANARCYSVKSDGKTNTDAENKATCENNKDCILALSAAIGAMPDCSYDGVNLRENFKQSQQSLVEKCEKLGVKVSGASRVGASVPVAAAAFAVVAVTLVHA